MTISIKPTASGSTIEQDGSPVLSIDSNRNVGIGTSSPTTTANKNLHISATSGQSSLVRVTGNGATGLDLLQGADSTGYLWLRDNAELLFGTNNATRMRIDSSGRVTMPYTPKFLAYFTNNTDFNIGGIYIFNDTKFNQGNHYSTSTGTFTAPVTGLYNFTWNIFLTNSAGATQSMYQAPYVNGGYYSGVDAYQTGAIPNSTGGIIIVNNSVQLQLNANDNFQLAIRGSTNRIYGGHSWMGGYLIG